MKLLFVSWGHSPLGFGLGSGAENYLLMTADLLRESGHLVSILAPDGSQVSNLDLIPVCGRSDPNVERQAGESAIQIGVESLTTRIWNQVRLIQGDFDLIVNFAYDWLPMYLSPFLKTPVLHSLLVSATNHVVDGALRDLCATLEKPRVAFLTRAQAETFEVPSKSYRVLGYGLQLQDYEFVAEAAYPKFLSWAGRILPEKGLADAVEAAARAHLPLVVSGPIIDEQYWRLCQLLAENLGAQLLYKGKLNRKELQSVMGASVGFLMTPKWVEALGIVVLEALACGTPVIAYRRGGPRDVVRHGYNGFLVDPDRVDKLTEAIVVLGHIDRGNCRRSVEEGWSADSFRDAADAWIRDCC